MHYYHYPTPYGALTIAATKKGVCSLAFDRQTVADATFSPSEHTNMAATQVHEYLAGKRFSFDIALDVEGTEFQQAVWRAVMRIPYGATCTPSDIARALGRPSAHRSVGAALAKNPVAIIIPDHRVVTSGAVAKGADRQAQIKAMLRAFEQNYNAERGATSRRTRA